MVQHISWTAGDTNSGEPFEKQTTHFPPGRWGSHVTPNFQITSLFSFRNAWWQKTPQWSSVFLWDYYRNKALVKVNAKDRKGTTALLIAARRGYREIDFSGGGGKSGGSLSFHLLKPRFWRHRRRLQWPAAPLHTLAIYRSQSFKLFSYSVK